MRIITIYAVCFTLVVIFWLVMGAVVSFAEWQNAFNDTEAVIALRFALMVAFFTASFHLLFAD